MLLCLAIFSRLMHESRIAEMCSELSFYLQVTLCCDLVPFRT